MTLRRLRPQVIVSAGVVAAMLALTLWAWPQVPADARIPIHFGLGGNPNGYAGRTVGLLLIPSIAALVAISRVILPALDPRRPNLLRSAMGYTASWMAALGVLAVVHLAIVSGALRHPLNVRATVGAAVGVSLVLVGNYMGKIRSNYFVGIRTPWTLSSELSWNRTHRLGGRLFLLLGLALVLSAFLNLVVPVIVVGSVAVSAVLTVYSYVVWRQDSARAKAAVDATD